MLCLGGLTRLEALHLEECWLQHGASVLALRGLQLCALELRDVMGPSPEALDDALRALPNLHRLHVSEAHCCVSLWQQGRRGGEHAVAHALAPLTLLLNPLPPPPHTQPLA